MIIKQASDGEWYVYRQRRGRNWFFVRYSSRNRGLIPLRNIYLPKEFIGKKVKLKIEELE